MFGHGLVVDTQEQFFERPGKEFLAVFSSELVCISVRENIIAISFGGTDVVAFEGFLLPDLYANRHEIRFVFREAAIPDQVERVEGP